MSKIRGVGVAAVFLAGCAVGGFSGGVVVPKASAQQTANGTRYEYQCVVVPDFAEVQTNDLNRFAAEYWELVSVQPRDPQGTGLIRAPKTWCLRRPKA